MNASSDSIYYFLGSIPSHVLHALPLYRKLGGSFVVTSKQAEKSLQPYGVPIVRLDDVPYVWEKGRIRPFKKFAYVRLGSRHQRTIEYLNNHAKIILFYEVFEFPETELPRPKKIFLTHGNMLKNYLLMYPKRIDIINKQYDFMAAIGPYMHEQFIQCGVNPTKLVKMGIARSDDVYELHNQRKISEQLAKAGVSATKPIVSYLPTYWGDSSVDSLGLDIASTVSADYQLLIRLHPQTPEKIVKKYKKLNRENVHLLLEADGQGVGLLEIMAASSVILGDLSSVMLEAVLLDTPLLFVETKQSNESMRNEQINEIYEMFPRLTSKTIGELNEIISSSINCGIDEAIWERVKNRAFYDPRGGSTKRIVDFVHNQLVNG